jgi:hypothetical protein
MWFDKKSDCSSLSASSTYPIDVPTSGACATTTSSYPAVSGANYVGYSLSTIEGVDVPPVATGTCQANPATPVFPAPTWTDDVRACGEAASATVGGGCALGQCLPKPATPFGTKLCVYKAGQSGSCPTGYPVLKPLEYQTWAEGRTCSCQCGGIGCGGALTLYSDLACSANPQTIKYDANDCQSIGGDPTRTGVDTRSLKWTGAGPVCGDTKGTLAGVPVPDPSDAITICCQSP